LCVVQVEVSATGRSVVQRSPTERVCLIVCVCVCVCAPARPLSEIKYNNNPLPRQRVRTQRHTILTRDKRPCPRRDSNPQSQQASGRRPDTFKPRGYQNRQFL